MATEKSIYEEEKQLIPRTEVYSTVAKLLHYTSEERRYREEGMEGGWSAMDQTQIEVVRKDSLPLKCLYCPL